VRQLPKGIAVLLVLVLALSLFAGCGKQAAPGEEPGGEEPGGQTGEQPAGDEEKVLIVAQAGDIETIDNDKSVGPAKNAIINFTDWQWIGYATKEGPNGQLMSDVGEFKPRLVESWEEEELPDGRCKYTLHVRQGMKFHSGNEVTAEDLKFVIMRRAAFKRDWLERTQGALNASDETVKVVDKYTLECITERPSKFLYVYTQRNLVDSKAAKEQAAADDPWAENVLNKTPLGGGPFKVMSWTPGVEMVMEKFDEWWGPEVKLDKLIWRVVPSVDTRVLLLKKGEIDVALDLPSKEINNLRQEPGIKVVSAPSANQLFIGMNAKMEPFDDKKVREAMAYAFPYDDVVDLVFLGEAVHMTGPVPTTVPNWEQPERLHETDLDKARQCLEEAGYDKLEVELAYDGGNQTHEDIAILFQANLGEIGVECNLKKMTGGSYNTACRNKELPFFFYESLSWIQTADYILNMNFEGSAHTNVQDYRNERVDQLLADCLDERDPEVKKAMLKEAESIILQDLPWIFICQPNFQLAMRDNIEGYVYQNTQLHHFWLVDKK